MPSDRPTEQGFTRRGFLQTLGIGAPSAALVLEGVPARAQAPPSSDNGRSTPDRPPSALQQPRRKTSGRGTSSGGWAATGQDGLLRTPRAGRRCAGCRSARPREPEREALGAPQHAAGRFREDRSRCRSGRPPDSCAWPRSASGTKGRAGGGGPRGGGRRWPRPSSSTRGRQRGRGCPCAAVRDPLAVLLVGADGLRRAAAQAGRCAGAHGPLPTRRAGESCRRPSRTTATTRRPRHAVDPALANPHPERPLRAVRVESRSEDLVALCGLTLFQGRESPLRFDACASTG